MKLLILLSLLGTDSIPNLHKMEVISKVTVVGRDYIDFDDTNECFVYIDGMQVKVDHYLDTILLLQEVYDIEDLEQDEFDDGVTIKARDEQGKFALIKFTVKKGMNPVGISIQRPYYKESRIYFLTHGRASFNPRSMEPIQTIYDPRKNARRLGKNMAQ